MSCCATRPRPGPRPSIPTSTAPTRALDDRRRDPGAGALWCGPSRGPGDSLPAARASVAGSRVRGLEGDPHPASMPSRGAGGDLGDALRRMAGQLTYLYTDGSRYRYDTHPTVIAGAIGRRVTGPRRWMPRS